MIAVTSPGFVLFAALLAGLWYVCPPPRRWQLLLGANLLFYAVLCPAALPVLAGSSFLVWWCGRRTAKKPVFLAGLAAALLPLALLKYLPAALGWQGTLANALGIGYFTLQLVSYLCDVRRGRILPEEKYARLLCYASFFLSITQGPFNRYDALMPQLDRPTVWDTDRVWRGVQRSAWGGVRERDGIKQKTLPLAGGEKAPPAIAVAQPPPLWGELAEPARSEGLFLLPGRNCS